MVRSRADVDTAFYAGLIRTRLVLPGILSGLAGVLLWVVGRDVAHGRAAGLLPALRRRLAARSVWLAVTGVVAVAVALHASLVLVSAKGNDYDAA